MLKLPPFAIFNNYWITSEFVTIYYHLLIIDHIIHIPVHLYHLSESYFTKLHALSHHNIPKSPTLRNMEVISMKRDLNNRPHGPTVLEYFYGVQLYLLNTPFPGE